MAANCNAVNIYDSLIHCKGETVLPGLRPQAYAIPKSAIVKWPTLPKPSDEGATMESIATYKGDFALAADAKWLKIDLIDTASNISSASQGEFPSKTFINNATLKFAGNNESASGFARMALTDDMIYVVQQRDGKFRVVGNRMFSTNTNPSQESGMAVTDASGTTFEASVTDVCPFPFYPGKLVTEDGVLDCATGELEAAA